jgi:chromosome segregation ATPase
MSETTDRLTTDGHADPRPKLAALHFARLAAYRTALAACIDLDGEDEHFAAGLVRRAEEAEAEASAALAELARLHRIVDEMNAAEGCRDDELELLRRELRAEREARAERQQEVARLLEERAALQQRCADQGHELAELRRELDEAPPRKIVVPA